MKIGASVSNQAVTLILNTTAYADVDYAIDLLSANDKRDLGVGIPTIDGKDVVFDADVQLVPKYSDIALDAYYATKASPKKDKVNLLQSS